MKKKTILSFFKKKKRRGRQPRGEKQEEKKSEGRKENLGRQKRWCFKKKRENLLVQTNAKKHRMKTIFSKREETFLYEKVEAQDKDGEKHLKKMERLIKRTQKNIFRFLMIFCLKNKEEKTIQRMKNEN